jgi:5-methylcytosine-specific restriction endonuclease McrA
MPFNKKGECRNTGRTHFKKGIIPWNKGKTGVYPESTLKAIGEASSRIQKERGAYRKGKPCSKDTINKIKEAVKNQVNRKGPKGKSWSDLRRKAHIPKPKTKPVIMNGKEYHPMWNEIRRVVYKRDHWLCQECGVHCSDRDKTKIACHHIDYNISNNDLSNLITLCASCHGKTAFRREDWIIHYRKKMEIG